MFIGKIEIDRVETIEGKDESAKVIFKAEANHPEIVLHRELLNNITTETEGNGTVTDTIVHYLAKKFLAELASYNLDFFMARGVGTALEVLAHNLREQAIGKAFGVTSSDSIPLEKLIPEETEEYKSEDEQEVEEIPAEAPIVEN